MSDSDEAVEAAAKGLAVHRWPTAIGVWDSFGQGTKDDFRNQARAALESAAPHIKAQALEEAADAIDADPYDDLDPFYVGWLNARAENIREAE